MREEAVVIENMTKRYGSFVLDNISLSIPGGCIMGLIGENGAGKSTTIKAMLNLINRDGGEVKILGKDIDSDSSVKEQVGVVFESCHFQEMLTADQIDRIMGGIYSNWDSRLFQDYLERFSLPRRKNVKDFSRGMTMKLSISTALAHRPRLLILDEATSGLDPVARDEILDLFFEFISDEEHSILISSHITSDLDKIADYIAMLHQGKLMFVREKDQMLEDLGVVRCSGEMMEKLIGDGLSVLRSRKRQFGAEALIAGKPEARERYRDLVIDDTNLEEIMLFYVKGDKKCSAC